MKHTPATPLPWKYDYDVFLPEEWAADAPVTAGDVVVAAAFTTNEGPNLAAAKSNGAYLAHAANAYPRLVAEVGMLRRSLRIAAEMVVGERRKDKAEIDCFAGRLADSAALLAELGE